MFKKPVIGISSCLMGNEVRFDGGHKRSRLITDVLAKKIQFKTICPEMGIGLGTPRPAIRLEAIGNNDVRLLMSKDKDTDLTDKIKGFAESNLVHFSDVDGFIFKKGSPSCGAWRVPVVIHEDGHRRHDGTGVFAQAFMQRYPWIPVEEEGRLNDTNLRECFLERVYALHRWRQIKDPDTNLRGLIDFHASHKLMLMARNQVKYRELGQFVANTTIATLAKRRADYLLMFMKAMQTPTSNGKHVNVLMHIMGYLKNKLSKTDKSELLDSFESFRNNYLPLSAIMILLKHHLRRFPVPYLNSQCYLEPCPREILN